MEWTEEADQAFRNLKQRLIQAPVLGYPDPTLPYLLDIDASQEAVGAVLSQVQEGKERVVAFFSKTLMGSERNYCVTFKELLAVVKTVKHLRPYLYGRKFVVSTDHASLQWLCRCQEPTSQVARWLEILSEFRFTVSHRAGRRHANIDGLSCRPCEDCSQCEHITKRDGGPTWTEMAEESSREERRGPSSRWKNGQQGSNAMTPMRWAKYTAGYETRTVHN